MMLFDELIQMMFGMSEDQLRKIKNLVVSGVLRTFQIDYPTCFQAYTPGAH